MNSAPGWVRGTARFRRGAEHIRSSAAWTDAAHRVDDGLREHYLTTAQHLAQAAVDDSCVPAAFLTLQAEGFLAEVAGWNSGGGRIAGDFLSAAMSLDAAGLPLAPAPLTVLFRLLDRIDETIHPSEWWCGLCQQVDCGDGLITQALDARLVRHVLANDGGADLVFDLYVGGIRTADQMAEAVAHPSAIAVGAL